MKKGIGADKKVFFRIVFEKANSAMEKALVVFIRSNKRGIRYATGLEQ